MEVVPLFPCIPALHINVMVGTTAVITQHEEEAIESTSVTAHLQTSCYMRKITSHLFKPQ